MKSIVVWNKESQHIGQLPHGAKTTAGIPQPGGIVIFLPGVNLVDSEALATLRKNPGFDQLFTLKIPPSAAPEQAPEKVGKPHMELLADGLDDNAPLAKLKPKDLEKVIGETFNENLLKEWMMGEDMAKPVRKLIEQQLNKVNAGVQPRTSQPA